MTDLRTRPAVEPDLRTQRRFARRRWARRWLAWKRVLAVVLVLGLLAAGVWVVAFSSLLAVRTTTVVGLDRLDEATVREAAGVPLGQPLARVDLGAVRSRVAALPAVAAVDVSRQWPHAVRVVVTERTPVAVVERDGRLSEMDAEGVSFRTVAKQPRGLPLVDVAPRAKADALAEVAQVVTALPDDILAKVQQVQVETIDTISLDLRGGRTVVWGSAESSADKAAVLDVLLSDRQTRRADEFDVSVPGSPTTR